MVSLAQFLTWNKKLEVLMKIKATQRKMTVCSADTNKSMLIIKGKWFRDCGFNPGDMVELSATKSGKLIITNKGNKYK